MKKRKSTKTTKAATETEKSFRFWKKAEDVKIPVSELKNKFALWLNLMSDEYVRHYEIGYIIRRFISIKIGVAFAERDIPPITEELQPVFAERRGYDITSFDVKKQANVILISTEMFKGEIEI